VWEGVEVDPAGNGASGTGEQVRALPVLVNIGDLLSYWTNGLLRSTVHRVVVPRRGADRVGQRDRYSIAYFCHPLDDAELVGVPSEIVREHAMANGVEQRSGDKVLTAKDHLLSRLNATYHDRGS